MVRSARLGGAESTEPRRMPSRTVTLGRVQPQAPSYRTVYCNDREANNPVRFKGNSISTTKYNVLTFLPKGLFEQPIDADKRKRRKKRRNGAAGFAGEEKAEVAMHRRAGRSWGLAGAGAGLLSKREEAEIEGAGQEVVLCVKNQGGWG